MTVTLPIKTASRALAIEGLVMAHGATQVVHGLDLQARAGEVLTLLGPSGCGKTTTLRAIAGLETPRAGRIAIAGNTVFDAATGIDLPPERRGLSMVFQSYAIWPHMTVFDNVAFGLRARGGKRADIAAAVRHSLDSVGLAQLADRPATRLSGGQQQRVALARAIACNPGVILLDEPLSNLDAQLRLAMRAEFKTLQRRLGLTAVYVTHDQEEALVLSDRIVVMRDGKVEQAGTPAEIHDAPASRFVADFMGVRNLLPCRIAREGGQMFAMLDNGARLAVRGAVPDGAACIGFRPSAVQVSRDPVPGAFAAMLAAATYLGDTMQYELIAGPLTIHARVQPRFDLAESDAVHWSVSPDACFLVPA
jgi:iron(III) transport system ATP-binding protein